MSAVLQYSHSASLLMFRFCLENFMKKPNELEWDLSSGAQFSALKIEFTVFLCKKLYLGVGMPSKSDKPENM